MVVYLTIGCLIGLFLMLMYDACIKVKPELLFLGFGAIFLWPFYIILPLAYFTFKFIGSFIDWTWLIYTHPVHPDKQ